MNDDSYVYLVIVTFKDLKVKTMVYWIAPSCKVGGSNEKKMKKDEDWDINNFLIYVADAIWWQRWWGSSTDVNHHSLHFS